MEVNALTWKDLADKISQMTEEKKEETVKVWGADKPLETNVCLSKENEDMCYYKDHPEDGCDFMSNLDKQCDDEIVVALKAGMYFLEIY